MENTKILNVKPLCFTPQFTKEIDRLDCIFYHSPLFEKLKRKSAFNLVKFDNFIKAGGLVRDPNFYNVVYLEEGPILVLKGENITKDGYIDIIEADYISFETHNRFIKTEILLGDLIFSVRGTIGKVAVIPNTLGKSNISANLIKIRLTKDANPYFFRLFLRSEFAQAQIEKVISGALQPTITSTEIRNFLVPDVPKNIQDNIVSRVQKYEIKAKENLDKYNQLVEEIRNIVPNILDIELPKSKVKYCRLKSSKLKDEEERTDCYFHSQEYKNLVVTLKSQEKKGKYKLIRGDDLNILIRRINEIEFAKQMAQEFKYIEVKHTEKDIGLITGCLEDILLNLPDRARQKVKTNDVIIPRPIGSTEAIAIVPKEYNGQLCSTGFIIIRPKDFDEAILLWTIFKSDLVQKQFFYVQSGSLQPEITPRNFRNRILIPIPNPKIREKIIKEIKIKIEQAKQIRKEYESNLEKSKEVFLKCIFKGTQ